MNGKIMTSPPPVGDPVERATPVETVLNTDQLVKIYGGRAVVNA